MKRRRPHAAHAVPPSQRVAACECGRAIYAAGRARCWRCRKRKDRVRLVALTPEQAEKHEARIQAQMARVGAVIDRLKGKGGAV